MIATDRTTPSAVRCTAADLRLQWSNAHSRRVLDPTCLERLRRRVAEALDAIEVDLRGAQTPASRVALVAERDEVRSIDAALKRMDARAAQAASVAATRRRTGHES